MSLQFDRQPHIIGDHPTWDILRDGLCVGAVQWGRKEYGTPAVNEWMFWGCNELSESYPFTIEELEEVIAFIKAIP
jgi:hypothetical protein